MGMTGMMRVGDIECAPGQVKRGHIEVAELADGSRVRVPIVLVNGVNPGPRLFLGATIHGDEVDGTAILSAVVNELDPDTMSGQVVCIPVQQPLALYADHRIPLAQFLKSPLDQAPADAWTCFPGSADGNLAQRFAYFLLGIIAECDFAIDVHTPTRGGRYVPIAILPHPSIDGFEKAEALAKAMDPGYIMRSEEGIYVNDGILCVEATRSGVPCFTFEIGEGGRLESEVIQTGASCIRNGLEWLGIVGATRVPATRRFYMSEFVGLRAERGGLLYTEATLGEIVYEGELLCRIVDVFGDEVQSVRAPVTGAFVRSTTLSTVGSGDRVATLGLIVDQNY